MKIYYTEHVHTHTHIPTYKHTYVYNVRVKPGTHVQVCDVIHNLLMCYSVL